MRKLSPKEKKFIKKLVEISKKTQDVFLGNIIYDELSGIDIYIDYTKNKVEFRYDKKMYDFDPSEFFILTREFSWNFRRYIQLLNDLEKEDMLFLYQESEIKDKNKRFGGLVNGREYIPWEVSDKKTVDSIIEYSVKSIIINESLKHFVENNYQTDEEIRFNYEKKVSADNLKIAKNTLLVTIVALFLTIVTSLIQIFSPDRSSPNLDNKSKKQIISALWSIHDDVHKKDSVK